MSDYEKKTHEELQAKVIKGKLIWKVWQRKERERKKEVQKTWSVCSS